MLIYNSIGKTITVGLAKRGHPVIEVRCNKELIASWTLEIVWDELKTIFRNLKIDSSAGKTGLVRRKVEAAIADTQGSTIVDYINSLRKTFPE